MQLLQHSWPQAAQQRRHIPLRAVAQLVRCRLQQASTRHLQPLDKGADSRRQCKLGVEEGSCASGVGVDQPVGQPRVAFVHQA